MKQHSTSVSPALLERQIDNYARTAAALANIGNQDGVIEFEFKKQLVEIELNALRERQWAVPGAAEPSARPDPHGGRAKRNMNMTSVLPLSA